MSDPTVKEAVCAAVSNLQYKLKWVPPERRDDVDERLFSCAQLTATSRQKGSKTTHLRNC